MRGSSLALLGLLLVGCQDGISVDANESTFCDTFAEVACHDMYQCCTEAQIENELQVSDPRTEVQCREDKTRSCIRASASVRDSLKAGRVTFNADAFNTCLQTMLAPDGTCSSYADTLPWTEPCKAQIWTGTVAIGGTCFFDFDCAGSPKTAACGPNQKCVALPVAGFPCVNGDCAADFFCGTGGTCQAKLAEGAPCTSFDSCQENLFCDTSATPMPVCAKRQPGGVACTSSQGCISNECVPGQCKVTGTTCYNDTQCFGRCADDNSQCTVGMDYMCNSSGHCDTVTSTTCYGSTADTQCVNAGAGTRCIFNVTCVAGDCIGDPVCTAPLFLADYCQAGLSLAP